MVHHRESYHAHIYDMLLFFLLTDHHVGPSSPRTGNPCLCYRFGFGFDFGPYSPLLVRLFSPLARPFTFFFFFVLAPRFAGGKMPPFPAPVLVLFISIPPPAFVCYRHCMFF